MGREVLIIENEPLIADYYERELAQAGIESHVEFNGKNALAIALERAFSVILLDLGLDDMCGIEVLRSLRRFGSHETTPVIVISGYTDKELQQSVLDAKANLFLSKPVSADQLLTAVLDFYA